MNDFAIECTMCSQTFGSENDFSNHNCSSEEAIDLLPIKQEVIDDFNMPEVDCQLTEIKCEPENQEEENTTVEIDPLALLNEDLVGESESTATDTIEDIEQQETGEFVNEETNVADENNSVVNKCLNTFNCTICGSVFDKKEKFTRHFRREHSSYRPYECHICHKKFLHKHYVSMHMRVHTGEKPYKCSLCPKAYSHKTSFTIHMRIHNGERPYICKYCGKKCYDKSGLTSHLRSHTKETPYQCEVCGRRFTHSKSLLVHRRNHTGEKPYVCSYCGKAFRHWHKHKIHIRLHTGERPYKCKVCNKGFPRNDEVTRHMKSHTGIKSFKCSICGVYCATQASITGHINLHHQNLKQENETPPEKTLVQDGKTGILGYKAPESRYVFKPKSSKVHHISKTDKQGASTSNNTTTPIPLKSPTKVIEITSKDIPLSLPIKSTKLQTAMPRSDKKGECETTLNNTAFKEWQKRMLTKQGLVVQGVSGNVTSKTLPISTISPTVAVTPSVNNHIRLPTNNSKYMLITQGTGPNATKILLPLNMTGGTVPSLAIRQNNGKAQQQTPLLLMQSNIRQQSPMFFMTNTDSKHVYVVSPHQKNEHTPTIKQEPIDPLLHTDVRVKTECPSPTPSPPPLTEGTNIPLNIKQEPV